MMTDISYDQWGGWDSAHCTVNHFFQSYQWFTVLTSTWNDLHIRIRSFDEGYILPVFTRKLGPLVLEGSPLRGYCTPYGGCLGAGDNRQIEKLLRGDFNEISLEPRDGACRAEWAANKTIILDLTPGADAVWRSMKSETRKQTTKAINNNVEIRVSTNGDWVDDAYAILAKTYERQRLPLPVPKRFYRQMAAILDPVSLKVFTAYYHGMPVSYVILGRHNKTVYGIDGGLDREYQHVRPNNLIHWHIIQWAIAEGCSTYDMVGGDIHNIARFKLGFGGRMIDYNTVVTTPTVLGKIAWRGYHLLRPALKQLYRIGKTE